MELKREAQAISSWALLQAHGNRRQGRSLPKRTDPQRMRLRWSGRAVRQTEPIHEFQGRAQECAPSGKPAPHSKWIAPAEIPEDHCSQEYGAFFKCGENRYPVTPRAILSARISLPGLNRIVFPGGIATSSPVRGLRPTPLFRGLTIKTPNPRSSILSPRFSAFLRELNTDSTAISAFTFVIFSCSATRFTMSCLITLSLP